MQTKKEKQFARFPAFIRFANKLSREWESNPQPTVYKTVALPVELSRRNFFLIILSNLPAGRQTFQAYCATIIYISAEDFYENTLFGGFAFVPDNGFCIGQLWYSKRTALTIDGAGVKAQF